MKKYIYFVRYYQCEYRFDMAFENVIDAEKYEKEHCIDVQKVRLKPDSGWRLTRLAK